MTPYLDTRELLTTLLEKYGLEVPPLAEPGTSVMRVPVIGPFSAGKSSLLNALAQTDLLPVGVTATTLYPTELRHGDNTVRVHRNGALEAAEPGELHSLNPAGVTRVEAACDLPFLRRIPGLLLVDTPGLDSTAAQETLLREELKACGGCILVFPADDPVMKPGAAAALAALPAGTPVMAFLNKCDKLLPEELDASAAFLRASLQKLPGMGTFPVGRVSARRKDVEPLREALLALQARASGTGTVPPAFRRAAGALRRYLCLRLEAANLIGASVEDRDAALRNRLDHLRQLREAERVRFEANLDDCLNRTKEQLSAAADEIALPVETLFFSGKDPTIYVADFFRELVMSCYRRDFVPAAESYMHAIGTLMRLREHPETFTLPSNGDLFPPSALDLQIGDDPFPGMADMLSQALMSLNCLTRAGKRDKVKRATAILLPELCGIAWEAAGQILRERADILRREVEKVLRQEEALAEKAYSAPPGHIIEKSMVRADLETLDARLSALYENNGMG